MNKKIYQCGGSLLVMLALIAFVAVVVGGVGYYVFVLNPGIPGISLPAKIGLTQNQSANSQTESKIDVQENEQLEKEINSLDLNADSESFTASDTQGL